MVKQHKPLSGLTLIELMVTVSIVVILAGVSIANMNKLRRPKDLVDEATSIIVNTLNQANATAMSTGTTQLVCNLTAGATSAVCPVTSPSTWTNINGSIFNLKVQVTITSSVTPLSSIVYCSNGGLYPIACPPLPPATPSSPFPSFPAAFVITATTPTDDSVLCFNQINLWPNGVINVVKNCNS